MTADFNNVKTIALRDDRTLGYSEYGAKDGLPVMYCHAFPGSRLGARLLDRSAHAAGIHLIAADRPGIGLSQSAQRRTVADWAYDIDQLADAVGIQTFSVFGVGGGGPYALACAALLKHRVLSAAIVGGTPPSEAMARRKGWLGRYVAWMGRKLPFLHVLPLSLMRQRLQSDPREALSRWVESHTSEDRVWLHNVETRAFVLADLKETFRQGIDGAVEDSLALDREWGFKPESIRAPVQIWQGERDRSIPPEMARYQQLRIPKSQAFFVREDAHLSLLMKRGPEILRGLAHA